MISRQASQVGKLPLFADVKGVHHLRVAEPGMSVPATRRCCSVHDDSIVQACKRSDADEVPGEIVVFEPGIQGGRPSPRRPSFAFTRSAKLRPHSSRVVLHLPVSGFMRELARARAATGSAISPDTAPSRSTHSMRPTISGCCAKKSRAFRT